MNGMFRKGESGNPAGRPRRQCPPKPQTSDFDVLLDRSLSIAEGAGAPRALTVEEALLWKTYQAALAGKRSAQRAILKLIVERDAEQRARMPKDPVRDVKMTFSIEPDNANRALRILNIAAQDCVVPGSGNDDRLKLEPWAVQMALDRRRGLRLTDDEVRGIRRVTRGDKELRFPGRGSG